MAQFESDAWTAYWSAGALHSCADGFEGNYAGEIAAFWRETLAAQPTCALRVLDLATGNAAIPRLLASLFPERNLEIDAVDRAGLRSVEMPTNTSTQLRMHGQVAIEQLPFPARHFNLVCSQFGLEYADREASIAEIARVAGERATFAWIAHHQGSVIARTSRTELAIFDVLLDEDGLITAAIGVVPWIVLARTGRNLRGDPAAELARKRFNRVQQALDELARRSPSATLDDARSQVQLILNGRAGMSADAQIATLTHYRQALEFGRERTRQMLAAAMCATDIEQCVALFSRHREVARSQHAELRDRGNLLGWQFTLQFAD